MNRATRTERGDVAIGDVGDMANANPSTARLRFARALLPSLLHDIGNTTQRLVGVRALLDVEELEFAASASSDLAWASQRSSEQGWLLGVLAEALGVDGLLQRRSSRGLSSTLRLVAAGLSREGRELCWSESESPLLSTRESAPNAAALCVAFGAIVFEAGMNPNPDSRALELLFEPDGEGMSLHGSDGAPAAVRAFGEFGETFGELQMRLAERRWSLRAPREWFEAAPK